MRRSAGRLFAAATFFVHAALSAAVGETAGVATAQTRTPPRPPSFFADLARGFVKQDGRLYLGINLLNDVSDTIDMMGKPLVRGWNDGVGMAGTTVAPFFNAYSTSSPSQVQFVQELSIKVHPNATFFANHSFLPSRILVLNGGIVQKNAWTGDYGLTAYLGDLFVFNVRASFTHSEGAVALSNVLSGVSPTGDPGNAFASDPTKNYALDTVTFSIELAPSKIMIVNPRIKLGYTDNESRKLALDPVTGHLHDDPLRFSDFGGNQNRFFGDVANAGYLAYVKGKGELSVDAGIKLIPNNAFSIDLGSKFTPAAGRAGTIATTTPGNYSSALAVNTYGLCKFLIAKGVSGIVKANWDVVVNYNASPYQTVVTPGSTYLGGLTVDRFRAALGENIAVQNFKTGMGIEFR